MAALKHSQLANSSFLYPFDVCWKSSTVTSVQMKIFLGAVVDGEFLTDLAEALLQKQEVLKVPVLMGITNHEFGWILPKVAQMPLHQSLWLIPLS